MRQTLAQFDSFTGRYSPGGSTHYALRTASGARCIEKITALEYHGLRFKAERIHILAPVPAKARKVEVPNPGATLCHHARPLNPMSGAMPRRRTRWRWARTLMSSHRGRPRKCRTAGFAAARVRQIGLHQRDHCPLLYRFGPDQLRFVMIDPKVSSCSMITRCRTCRYRPTAKRSSWPCAGWSTK